jgi:hypothetical protein
MNKFYKDENLMKNFFKSSLSHKFEKNYLKVDLSWSQVIQNIDLNIRFKYFVKYLDNCGIVLNTVFDIEEVNFILEQIKKNNPNHNDFSSHMYISLSKESKTFGRHKDNSDVWFLQCIGKTEWKIFDRDKIYSYILDPGDFLFVPKYMYHETIPLSPRMGISFGMDFSDKNLKYL